MHNILLIEHKESGGLIGILRLSKELTSMPSYSCDPGLEVTGAVARKLFATLERDQIMPFLKVHDLVEIDPEGWVQLLDVLNVMNDLAWLGGPTGNFVATGIHIAETSHLPPELETASPVAFWEAFNTLYQQGHRNGDPGTVATELLADDHLLLHFNNVPYPDDVMYGLVFGCMRRILPDQQPFSVYYDDKVLMHEQGGPSTLIHVIWQV